MQKFGTSFIIWESFGIYNHFNSRESTPRQNTSTGSSRTSSYNYSPLSVSPHLSPKGNYSLPSPYSPAGSALTPYYSSPLTPLDDNYFDPVAYLPGAAKRSTTDDQQDIHVTNQVGKDVFHDVQLKETFFLSWSS